MLLNQEQMSEFVDELFETVHQVVNLQTIVEKIQREFERLYVEEPTNEEKYWTLRAKLAKIRLMLMAEEDV